MIRKYEWGLMIGITGTIVFLLSYAAHNLSSNRRSEENIEVAIGPVEYEYGPHYGNSVFTSVIRIKENGKRYLYIRNPQGGIVLEPL